MIKFLGPLVAAVLVLTQMAVAQTQDDQVWVQIEAHPSLTVAEERARRYAAEMPDVNGFALGGSWYGVALGPYAPEDAQQVLRVYRAERKIPRDSYITGARTYGQQFFPRGAAANTTPPSTTAPVATAPVQTAPVPQQPEPILLVDETPAQARASERQLTGEDRKDLQRALAWSGFYTAGIDGAFGAGTRRSMGDWQRANNYDPTGVLTTRQRAVLLDQYNEPLTSVGLRRHSDVTAGIAMDLPMDAIQFSHYQTPFAHYDAIANQGIRVLLISQPGDAANLAGLYDILQTLSIVPLDGPRERGRNGFTIEGRNTQIVTHVEASRTDGEIKGFILVWPANDDRRRARVLDAMKASFTRLPGVLDPLAGADRAQSVDLISGLEVRKPKTTGSGFFIDRTGSVITSTAAVEGCTRITLDSDYDAQIAATDAALGIALLRPRDRLAPMEVARLSTLLPRLQSEIAVAGFSFGGVLGAPTLTFGTLADTSGLSGEADLTRLALAANPGDVGGPVLDSGGAVVGMLLPAPSGGTQHLPPDVWFAAKPDAIAALLRQAGLGNVSNSAGQSVAPQDLMRLAEGMTVLVSCWN